MTVLAAPNVRLTAQQRAVLHALAEQSPLPTVIMYDVRVRYGDQYPGCANPDRTYRIGDPVYKTLRRLEARGLVTGEMGSDCKDWWITDAGLIAIGLGGDA